MKIIGIVAILAIGNYTYAGGKIQGEVSAPRAWQIQEFAYRQGFLYPAGPLRCSRTRCFQKWEKPANGD